MNRTRRFNKFIVYYVNILPFEFRRLQSNFPQRVNKPDVELRSRKKGNIQETPQIYHQGSIRQIQDTSLTHDVHPLEARSSNVTLPIINRSTNRRRNAHILTLRKVRRGSLISLIKQLFPLSGSQIRFRLAQEKPVHGLERLFVV
jgi:hypothetical protein